MTAVSGQYGKIMIGSSNITECMKWSFDRMASDHAYASCATGGYKSHIPGTKDGTGSMNGMQDPSDPIENYFKVGDAVTLKLYYTASKYYTVPARILKVHVETDIDDGSPVPWDADFAITGAWTDPA